MEMKDLDRWKEAILCDICQERFEEITVPGLRENIAKYKQTITNCAAALRQKGQLTHKGRQVKTMPDFKRICLDEGWNELLADAQEEKNNA